MTMNVWLDYLCKRVNLWKRFECVCKTKYGILSEINHGVVFCVLGQDKVM